MSQANVALIKRFYERYLTSGELPWDMLDERIEVHDHDTPDQGAYAGRAGVERWLRDWGDAWAEWSFEPEEFVDAGDAVIVVIRMRAKGMGRVSSLIARTQSSIASETTRSCAPITTTAKSRLSKQPASLPRHPRPSSQRRLHKNEVSRYRFARNPSVTRYARFGDPFMSPPCI